MQEITKTQLKQIFKNYKSMNARTQHQLNQMGISTEKRRKHWILRCNDKQFTCPSTGSDHRGGTNLALEIYRQLTN